MSKIDILDKGYVRLRQTLGTDDTPVDAARTSFEKSADQFSEERNDKLIKFLIRKKEFACFRHNAMSFELKIPIMTARQLWKYVVASNFTEDQLGWNEASKRYITSENEFYIPNQDEWRCVPDNKKQGSGDPVEEKVGKVFTDLLMKHCERGEELYQSAMEQDIAPELARLFLPSNAVYVTVYWTASLSSIMHMLDERLGHGAQKEVYDVAVAVESFVKQEFPRIYDAWRSEQ